MFMLRIKDVEFTFYDDGTVGFDVDYDTNQEGNILDLVDLEQVISIAKSRLANAANKPRSNQP